MALWPAAIRLHATEATARTSCPPYAAVVRVRSLFNLVPAAVPINAIDSKAGAIISKGVFYFAYAWLRIATSLTQLTASPSQLEPSWHFRSANKVWELKVGAERPRAALIRPFTQPILLLVWLHISCRPPP